MMIKLYEEDIVEAISRYVETKTGQEVGNINFEDCGGVCISHLSAECSIKEGE